MQAETTSSSSDNFFGLPFEVESDDGSEVYEVSLFVTTIHNIMALWSICRQYKVTLPDMLRDNPQAFINAVMAPNTVIFKIGEVGVAYATDIVPGDQAVGHYLFWDKKLKNRSKVILRCMRYMFDTFELARISVLLPRHASAALHHVYKMGFRLEGVLRECMLIGGQRTDCLLFGVLNNEVSEETVAEGHLEYPPGQAGWMRQLYADDPNLMHKIVER